MTVLASFALPSPDDSRAAHEVALAALNSIKLNEEHIRHGFGFLIAADFELPGAAAMRLLAYASTEGFYPADVAAQAIAIRAGWMHNLLAAGREPEVDWTYDHIASKPIALEDVGWQVGPENEEPIDDEIPW
ncbi:MAG TPA: hypothetical protein VF503_08150 [Sphingobium sp.]|uniref:hypothetical protein n=1 Tax=Sphingobium sp. TaxID=1912891 RepID=UPI002ED4D6AE